MYVLNILWPSSTSPHNKAVMATLVDEVMKDPENEYSQSTVACECRLIYNICIPEELGVFQEMVT